MLISYEFDDILRLAEVACSPQTYDSYPRPSKLMIEFVPSAAIRPNILAVAGCLAFRKSIEGEFSIDNTIDRPVAEALTKLLEQQYVHIPDVNFRPREPKRMPNVAALGVVGSIEPPQVKNAFDQNRELAIRLHPSASRVGWSMELPNIDLPTNAWMIAKSQKPYSLDWWGPFIAVILILADTFEIGTIRLPKMIDKAEERLLCDALRSVDISLEIAL